MAIANVQFEGRRTPGSTPPVDGAQVRRSNRLRRIQRLIAKILVVSIVGYPLLGTLVAFTDFPSSFASIPVRLSGVFYSALLIIQSGHRRNNLKLGTLYVFWAIYGVRLIADYLDAGIPGTDIDIVFFVATCVIPTVAVTRCPWGQWDEALIARWLAIAGAATCAFALLPFAIGMKLERSLLEETGRLSFDTVNPITYGHVAVTTIISGLVALQHAPRTMSRLAWGACIAIAAVALEMAASRGPAVALVACVISFALCSRSTRRLTVLSLCVAAFLAVALSSDAGILQRFAGFEEDPSTHERLVLQANAIQQFLDNPFFGSAHVELEFMSHPHNPMVEAAMAVGMVGLLLFAALSISMTFRIFSLLRRGTILIPLLGLQYLLGAQFSGALFQSNTMWIFMAMVFVSRKRKTSWHGYLGSPGHGNKALGSGSHSSA